LEYLIIDGMSDDGTLDILREYEKKHDCIKVISEADKSQGEARNKGLKIEGAKVKAADLFGTKVKERKLDDKQAKFVKAKQEGFTPEKVEDLEKEVDKFLDDTLEDYKKTAKIFGEKEPEGDKKGGGEPGEGSGDSDELIPD